MRWSAALGAGFVLSLGTLVAPAVAAPAASPASSAPAASAAASAELPADGQQRRAEAADRFGVELPAQEAVGRAIDPSDYDCGRTAFDDYVDGLLAGLTPAEVDFLFNSGAMEFPTYEALVFGTAGDPTYALEEQRRELSHAFRDARRFFDVESGDIHLLAMHGDMLLDPARIARVLEVVYGFPAPDAAEYAELVSTFVAGVPAFQGGDNPLFTLNAFAFSGEGDPDPFVSSIPDKLVFGDGIIDALESLGIGDVGPRAVMGHEFAHHVQYELSLFDSSLPAPEATRRTELMADGIATYFSTHKRGLTLNAKRVLQAERTFYEVGDCAFANPGHHGTPNQRLRASQWGADLAAAAQKQGHILPSATLAERFEAVLPELVAPDAG
jgi:hypothetical protein